MAVECIPTRTVRKVSPALYQIGRRPAAVGRWGRRASTSPVNVPCLCRLHSRCDACRTSVPSGALFKRIRDKMQLLLLLCRRHAFACSLTRLHTQPPTQGLGCQFAHTSRPSCVAASHVRSLAIRLHCVGRHLGIARKCCGVPLTSWYATAEKKQSSTCFFLSHQTQVSVHDRFFL